MLVKLMKHEFRATSRVMGPLYLALIVVSLGANLAANVLLDSDFRILRMLGGLLIAAFSIGVFGVGVMTVVLMVQRFQKNLLSDEGYLMFTLPVNVHQQVWSKLLVSAVWFAATFCVVCLAGGMFIFNVDLLRELIETAESFFRIVTGYELGNFTGIFLEGIVLAFVFCCVICLEFYAAMAMGYSMANHKALFSVACFFGFQFVAQTLGIVLINLAAKLLSLLPGNFFGMIEIPWDAAGQWTAIHLMMVVLIVGCAAYGAIFYGITTWFLKNKLNLE